MHREGKTRLVLLAGLLVCLVLFLSWIWVQKPGGSRNGSPVVNGMDMPTAIQAVAASENGKYDVALTLWQKLLDQQPSDPDLLLNQAVTVLKWIDETNSRLTSVVDPDKQNSLREELSAAIEKAESTIAKVAKLPGNDGRTALLQASFFEAKSRFVQPPEDQALRTEAAKVLIAALEKNSSQPLLACKLDDVIQELNSDDEVYNKAHANALYDSWKSSPRNLYVLVRAGETLLKMQDARMGELLQPSLEMAQPMMSMLASALGRNKPDELIAKVSNAVSVGDWRQAQQIRLWWNVLKGSSGFRPDGRLVKPDIMALLDTTFFERYAVAPSAPKTRVPLPKFESKKLIDGAQSAAWYDFDIDLDMDIVAACGSQLQLLATDAQKGVGATPAQQLAMPFAPSGMLVVDLFEVDNPIRPRIANVAQLAGDKDAIKQSEELSPEEIAKANRHDTIQELILWDKKNIAVVSSIEKQAGIRELVLLDKVPGLTDATAVQQIEPTDIDSDGDLDLILACSDGLRILQNNGNRTFMDISSFSSLSPKGFVATRLFACDVDHDLDQDVLLVGSDRGLFLLENILHNQFRYRKLEGKGFDGVEQAFDVYCSDLDGNASWDPCVVGPKGVNAVLTQSPTTGQWLGSRIAMSSLAGQHLQVADINNDALLDLVVAGDASIQARLGASHTEFSQSEVVITNGKAELLALQDADLDGNLDMLTLVDKSVVVCSQPSANGKYLSARVRGINDVNGGGRINHYAVGSTLELRSPSQMQARVIRSPSTHFGLGDQTPSNLRIIFNNGLTQNDDKLKTNLLVEEKQELKGSCPFVYGWNGQRFELITDLLWNAPLGLQIGRGKPLSDRRWEFLLLPGQLVQPKDGYYQLQITEELWEVAYFDHVALTAIDHPADVDVFTNEKVGPPGIAQHKIFAAKKKQFPNSARDSYGRDILGKLATIDRNFVQAFERQICQGYCEPHFIELDFGTLPVDEPLKLALSGWMHPTDTSLNIGLSQNPELAGPEPPSLWVVDQTGNWVCAQPFMGFPGGKPKSIVIDLAGVFRSDNHRIRIASSQQIYWDQVFIFNESQSPTVEQIELQLESAELHYRGFGRLMDRAKDQPHWYDYEDVNRDAKWPKLAGPFTRYGDVKELLINDDDRMVVMVSGDEFTAKFTIPGKPIPEGWKRDFVLHSIGWDKDADLNTLDGDGSLPLPFKAMSAYPPPAEQSDLAEEVLKLNNDHLKRHD
jgi:FG-GAP-like repeat